jgi:hypothetical protein
MSAEQREKLKRLADEMLLQARQSSVNSSEACRIRLHAAIDAHTAEPPINAAAQEPARVLSKTARVEQAAPPVAAAPNEPVAPLPSAELDLLKSFVLQAKQASEREDEPTFFPCEIEEAFTAIAILERAERASPQAVPAAPIKEDLAVLVRKLAYSLRKASPEHTLPNQAIEYLRRHDLQGSPLRISPAGPCALCHTNETGYVCTGRCEEHAAPQAVDAPVAPFAWYSARIDDCITDAKKRSRAKVQPWDAEHFDQPLYALKAPAKESEGSADV